MDAVVFERWFEERLIPNIPLVSVVVMDNASYHARCLTSYPLSAWKNPELKDWLISKGYKVSDDALRGELWVMAKE